MHPRTLVISAAIAILVIIVATFARRSLACPADRNVGWQVQAAGALPLIIDSANFDECITDQIHDNIAEWFTRLNKNERSLVDKIGTDGGERVHQRVISPSSDNALSVVELTGKFGEPSCGTYIVIVRNVEYARALKNAAAWFRSDQSPNNTMTALLSIVPKAPYTKLCYSVKQMPETKNNATKFTMVQCFCGPP